MPYNYKFCIRSILSKKVPNVHTFLEKTLRDHHMWLKIKLIRRNQPKIHSVPQSFHSKTVTGSVEMAVKTVANLILLQQ